MLSAFKKLLKDIRENEIRDPAILLTDYEMSDAEAVELAAALKENNHIKDVYLCRNQIENTGAEALASVTTLERLSLSSNRIGLEGVHALAHAPLKELDISQNDEIGDEGLACFLNHPTLIELTADACNITNKGTERFAAQPPRSLKRLSLKHNEIEDSGAKALTALRLDKLNLSYNNLRTEKEMTGFHSSSNTESKREEVKKPAPITSPSSTPIAIKSTKAFSATVASDSKWGKKTNRQIHQQLIQWGLFQENGALKKKSYELASSDNREKYREWATAQLSKR